MALKCVSGTQRVTGSNAFSVSGLSIKPVLAMVYYGIEGSDFCTFAYCDESSSAFTVPKTYDEHNGALQSYSLHEGGFSMTLPGDAQFNSGYSNYYWRAYYLE